MVDRANASRTSIDVRADAQFWRTLIRPLGTSGWWRFRPTAFPFEWLGVAALAAIDVAWATRIGFTLSATFRDALVLLAAVSVIILFRTVVRYERGLLVAEYFAVTTAATTAFAVLSYLSCTPAFPLVDDALLRFDRMLGFDWHFWARLLQEHPVVIDILQAAYDSLFYQALYFVAFLGVMLRRARLREIFWVFFIAGLLTCAGSMVFPALGAAETFPPTSAGDWLVDVKQLRAGSDLHFVLGRLKGVIAFPSFHTTMALVYAYGFRRTGMIGRAIAALNVIMLLGIPFIGLHYLADMIAGAAVAVVSILAVRSLPALRDIADMAADPRADQVAPA